MENRVSIAQQVLFAFVILEDEEFGDGLRQEFLRRGFAVVCEGKLDIERQRMRPAIQTPKDRLGFMELILHQSGDGGTDNGFALETLDLQHLPFGFRLGASGKILADALAIQPTGNAENDLPVTGLTFLIHLT